VALRSEVAQDEGNIHHPMGGTNPMSNI
jgi:hypothetical protein